jgi:hypothetical protein
MQSPTDRQLLPTKMFDQERREIPPRIVQIRGTQGQLFVDTMPDHKSPLTQLSWQEGGVSITLLGAHMNEEEVLQAAVALR